MPIRTLTQFTADELLKLRFKKGMRGSNSQDLADAAKYTVVLLKLAPSVTSDDYAALETAVKAVTGVQDVDLMFDFQALDVTLDDHVQVLQVIVDISLNDRTPDPEE
jgi:hypothetical protein